MNVSAKFNGQAEFYFDAKPSANIRGALKANGFRWSPSGGYWWRRQVKGAADLLDAIRAMLDREAGIRRPVGACWECKSPDGFFRSWAAATPVLCDACQAKREADYKKYGYIRGKTGREREFTPDPVDLAYEDQCARICGSDSDYR